jgi:hypothetical protein
MSGSCLVNSGDARIAVGEPALPSCDNLGRFEAGSSEADDCLRFARGDSGGSGSTGRITAEDIGLEAVSWRIDDDLILTYPILSDILLPHEKIWSFKLMGEWNCRSQVRAG